MKLDSPACPGHTAKPCANRSVSYCTVPQRYVDEPYLVGGKKFDLRIYALVTNYSPLRIFLYRRAARTWRCLGVAVKLMLL